MPSHNLSKKAGSTFTKTTIMAANNLRNTLNGLNFLSPDELGEVVKEIINERITLDQREELEKYIISEIKYDMACRAFDEEQESGNH